MDIPVLIGDKKADASLALELLKEVQPLGQSIGKLQAAMHRCRRTDSPTFIKYEHRLVELENRLSDILSFVKMVLRVTAEN